MRDVELRPRRLAHADEPARVAAASASAAARASKRIGEIFNLLNAKNPATFVTNQTSARFMQPNEFSGDFQNPEQRVGQIGFRF